MRAYLPLLVLITLAIAGFFLLRGVGWDTLARNQGLLLGWVNQHPLLAAGAYLSAYIATAALSLPNATILSVAGGLLFGALFGTVLTVVGASIGATILFLVVRSAFAGSLRRHRTRIPAALRDRLAADGFSYLLAVRLVPLFPFWIVNLAAAFAGISLRAFCLATLIGIIPASYILSAIGAGVGSILAQGKTPDLSLLFSARIILPLAGLALLSLLPAIMRRRPGSHA